VTAGRESPVRNVPAHLAIVAAAFLFGTTFYAVKQSVRDMQPIAFLALRFGVGALVLAPFGVRAPKQPGRLRSGVVVGAVLCAGYLFQTTGLQYTSTSKSAFITGLFVVFTPLAATVLFRRPPTWPTMVGVFVAMAGLFMLTGAHLRVRAGDALTLGCAVSFGVHIALLGELAPQFDPVVLNTIQLAVVSAACAVLVPWTGVGHVTARAVSGAVFTAVAASVGAFTLQVYGQRHVGPTRTGVLLVLEPVFAGLLGYAVGERLGALGVAGAIVILLGVVIAEAGPVLTDRSSRPRMGRPTIT